MSNYPIIILADKLAQTKIREREIKESHKLQLLEQKIANEERKQAQHKLQIEERALHNTRRAARDARHAAKHEARAESGAMCEHGVWRCGICFPHKSGKPRIHFAA